MYFVSFFFIKVLIFFGQLSKEIAFQLGPSVKGHVFQKFQKKTFVKKA